MTDEGRVGDGRGSTALAVRYTAPWPPRRRRPQRHPPGSVRAGEPSHLTAGDSDLSEAGVPSESSAASELHRIGAPPHEPSRYGGCPGESTGLFNMVSRSAFAALHGTLKIVIYVGNYPQKRRLRLAYYHPLLGWRVLISGYNIHIYNIYTY